MDMTAAIILILAASLMVVTLIASLLTSDMPSERPPGGRAGEADAIPGSAYVPIWLSSGDSTHGHAAHCDVSHVGMDGGGHAGGGGGDC